MPNAQWYLDNYSTASSMLDHAVVNYSASPKLDYVKVVNKNKEVRVYENGNPNNYSVGVAKSLREAVADALEVFTA